MDGHDGHGPGERFVPRWVIWLWNTWDFLTWPRTVRQLRQAGFRHTGWMTWESGPGSWTDNDPWGEEPWT